MDECCIFSSIKPDTPLSTPTATFYVLMLLIDQILFTNEIYIYNVFTFTTQIVSASSTHHHHHHHHHHHIDINSSKHFSGGILTTKQTLYRAIRPASTSGLNSSPLCAASRCLRTYGPSKICWQRNEPKICHHLV